MQRSFYLFESGKNSILMKVRKERYMELKLKALRVNAGLSLYDMAEILHVGKSTVSRWERDELMIPETAFYKYCEVCKVDEETKSQIQQKIRIKKRRDNVESRYKNIML